MTFNHQNPISLFLSPRGCLCQKTHKAYLRYCYHENGKYGQPKNILAPATAVSSKKSLPIYLESKEELIDKNIVKNAIGFI